MEKLDITAFILTLNEERHIRRCIESVQPIVKEVMVIDCFSSDSTKLICEELGARVVEHAWPGNHADQFNWALDNIKINTEWVLRLDADEYLEDDLKKELIERLPDEPDDVTGIEFHLKVKFLDKWMSHASPSIVMIRMFRTSVGRMERKLMDEHLILSRGTSKVYDGAFVDHNLNNITWWAQKHIGYAKREAADLLNIEYNLSSSSEQAILTGQSGAKRKMKKNYASKPLFLRSFIYFLYRYFWKLGFLDGKEGFLWCFMQGWWYRTLVDIQVYQIKHECNNEPEKIREYLDREFGIRM